MDGNGRWAAARGGSRSEGHRAGRGGGPPHRVRAARELGIPVSDAVRVLGAELAAARGRGRRPDALLRRFVLEERAELAARGIRLMTIGDEARLPVFVRGPLAALTRGDAREPRR